MRRTYSIFRDRIHAGGAGVTMDATFSYRTEALFADMTFPGCDDCYNRTVALSFGSAVASAPFEALVRQP
jgi:hypothetical protein